MRLNKDQHGKLLERLANSNPGKEAGARVTRAKYVPHTGELVRFVENNNEKAIFKENARSYEENKVKPFVKSTRSDLASGGTLNIPESDWQFIRNRLKQITGHDFYELPYEEKRKFMMNLYRDHPEYRNG